MSVIDRRRAARRMPASDEPLCRVRLRAGRELRVLDVSTGGVMVEGDVRLLPGTHLDVHIVIPEGRVLVRSRVVRAWVSALTADRVTYRGAFAFDRPIEVGPAGYGFPAQARGDPARAGISYPGEAA